ncbi:apolipoprotein C-I-like [Xyrichtys novacula]|uniref:Apolipoprotein C-I-like n=1 Tax=Xyrichtys novacula TaxID=13765 RepID=A0AAV1FQ16_XYRNO|nr:apolipoprotein C-I-like [Xyrichtys novacula]
MTRSDHRFSLPASQRLTAKMRLYLAVAVLMLAFVAYTEAQDDTIEEKFSKFGDQVADLGRNIAEKAKTTWSEIQNSEFATNSRNWFEGVFQKAKETFDGTSQ